MKPNVNYGLYLVTDREILKGKNFLSTLEEAIAGGVTMIQLREKNAASLEFYQMAVQAKAHEGFLCKYDLSTIKCDRNFLSHLIVLIFKF